MCELSIINHHKISLYYRINNDYKTIYKISLVRRNYCKILSIWCYIIDLWLIFIRIIKSLFVDILQQTSNKSTIIKFKSLQGLVATTHALIWYTIPTIRFSQWHNTKLITLYRRTATTSFITKANWRLWEFD